MKNACEEWKDALLEAALTGAAAKDLEEHLLDCTDCAAELRELKARRDRLDALLPMVGQGTEPLPEFRARVLAAAEAADGSKHWFSRQFWTLGAASVTATALLVLGVSWYRARIGGIPPQELSEAQKLADWRAPSDSLLATPHQELWRSIPKLGESYLNVPVKRIEEETR